MLPGPAKMRILPDERNSLSDETIGNAGGSAHSIAGAVATVTAVPPAGTTITESSTDKTSIAATAARACVELNSIRSHPFLRRTL